MQSASADSNEVEAAYNALVGNEAPIVPEVPPATAPKPLSVPAAVSEEAYSEAYAAALAQLNREKKAVAIIIRAWQRFSDQRIYRYYRDLIKFRERGDPQLMLKCINPGEAELVDAAAGIHVRFRLGGTQFPPVIYYKIFVHNAVCDINAFAPRDYTRHKAKTAKQQNVKGHEVENDHSGWYERMENNGWRPVADRALQMADATTQETSCRIIPFHHKPEARRQNKKQWLKLRKREWMMKMYKDGKEGKEPAQSPSADEDPTDGNDDFEDWDDEAAMLIDWSDALDFDSYVDDWGKVATSARSELFVGTSGLPLDFVQDEGDPLEVM